MTKFKKPARKKAELIREAAEDLFCSVGYDGVSMADIAKQAGVNKALLFYYFGSKVELFEKVLETYYVAHHEALAEAFELGGTLQERIHRMVDSYLDFMAENQRYARLVQQQVAESDTHRLIQKNLAPLFEWTVDALSGLAPKDGPLSARHFWVTFSGLVINYFTYAPLLEGMWGSDPLSPEALEERKAHVHWIVDIILEKLHVEKKN